MKHTRIAIAGGPMTGKTTLALRIARGRKIIHTDHYIHLGWSEASEAVADRLVFICGPLIVEGVAVPRALRKWLRSWSSGKPVDSLHILRRTYGSLSPGQERMAKGVNTVLSEILPELMRRGVEVRRSDG